MTGASAEPSPLSQAKQDPSGRQCCVVAVIDDDEAICDSTRILLEAHDFVVHTYQSAAAFLQEGPAVSCIVADYHMPGMNGLELISLLKDRGSCVPVIMITAAADARMEALAAQLGIKSVLHKPLGNALVSALQEELGRAP